MIKRRLLLVKHYLKGGSHVGCLDFWRFVLGPTASMKAKRFVGQVSEEDNNWLKVELANTDLPKPILYWPKQLPWSSFLQVLTETFVPTEWHYYEIPQTRVKPTDIVADLGSAEGLFALAVAHRAKLVYAVEPLSMFVEALHKTFAGYNNVVILPVAVGATESNLYLNTVGISSALSEQPLAGSEQVKVKTVDQLFFEQQKPITYLKADLEGFEMEMLAGAEQTIKKYQPTIVITSYHKVEHAEQIKSLILSWVPDYQLIEKGIEERGGSPVVLHFFR